MSYSAAKYASQAVRGIGLRCAQQAAEELVAPDCIAGKLCTAVALATLNNRVARSLLDPGGVSA